MGVFDDNKFEQLDWITQVTETIDSELNNIIARLPDRIEFDFTSVVTALDGGLSLSVRHVVRNLLNELHRNSSKNISWEDEQEIIGCFRFEMSEDLKLDFNKHQLVGSLTLVKVVQTIEDEKLQGFMGLNGLCELGKRFRNCVADINKLNEILDIIGGCEDAMRKRSAKKKIQALQVRLKTIFTTNEWRIRDMTLADKVSLWIGQYIADGNLAALTNLCKLKVMTHSNMPIYSVKEEI